MKKMSKLEVECFDAGRASARAENTYRKHLREYIFMCLQLEAGKIVAEYSEKSGRILRPEDAGDIYVEIEDVIVNELRISMDCFNMARDVKAAYMKRIRETFAVVIAHVLEKQGS